MNDFARALLICFCAAAALIGIPLAVASRMQRRSIDQQVARIQAEPASTREAVSRLVAALSSPYPPVREAARAKLIDAGALIVTQLIEELQASTFWRSLWRSLRRGENPLLRRAGLIDILGEIRSPDAVPALIRQVNASAIYAVFALQSLGKIGGEQARQTAFDHLHTDRRLIRVAAASSLAVMGNDRGLPVLIEVLESKNTKPDIMKLALEGIVHFPDTACPILSAWLAGPEDLRAEVAAEMLGGMGAASIPALESAAQDQNPRVRRLAILALERIPQPAARAVIGRAAHDSDPQVRALAQAIIRRSIQPPPMLRR